MRKSVDMTDGNTASKLLLFSLPMLLSAIFQQLYNVVDSIVAGYISTGTLAAVGSTGTVAYLYAAIGNGCAIGAGIIIAQYFGTKNNEKLKSAITTTVITILSLGVILTLHGLLCHDTILRIVRTPEEIFSSSASYFIIYLYGLIFTFLYNICNGVLTSLGNSRTPLYFLIFSSVLNVILDICFALKLGWGIDGLAWATTISQAVSAILATINLIITFIKIKSDKYIKFDIEIFNKLIRASVPSILQLSVKSFGQVAIQGVVNSFSTPIIAGYTAAGKVSGIFSSAICMLSSTTGKFTGQNYGAMKYDRINEGYKIGNIIGLSIAVISTAVVMALATPLLKLFGNELVTVEMLNAGRLFIYVLSPFYAMLAFKVVADGCVQGCLKMKEAPLGTVANLCVRVTLSFVLTYFFGYLGICIAHASGWVCGGIVSASVYYIVVVKKIIKSNRLKVEKEMESEEAKVIL